MARLRLTFLGSWQVTRDDQAVSGFESMRVRALLTYLAVEGTHPHYRAALAGLLWPDLTENAALANLRQALANLRKTLADSTAQPPLLLISRDTIQLNPAADFALDVAEFSALLTACERHRHRRLETCRACGTRRQQAVDLYRGDFLAGFFLAGSTSFEEWALLWRERLRRLGLEALSHLDDYYEQRAAPDLCQRALARQLELDPWREEAYRRLMWVLARAGQRSAALAQYEACCRALAEGLGVAPAAATTALYEQILAGAEIGGEKTPLPPPPPAAQLIGRETELSVLAERLADPDYRLLTIVGPGGIGKTRLAQAAAAEHGWAYRHGAVFVPLGPLVSADYLAPAMAQAMSLTLSGRAGPSEQLIEHLRDQELLLVLDNFEHLLPAALGLIDELLRRAAGVQLVITSRQRLDLPGEWVLALQGLPYPEAGSPGPVEAYGAVQLFLHNARRVHSAFAWSAAAAPAIATICRAVGGMPLALELAAAWVRVIGCEEIASELERGLGLLSTAPAVAHAQAHGLRTVFDRSWQLLSADEAAAFRRLAAFRGGFDREAAEQVAGVGLPLLLALLDKSLLRWDGAGRYDMHTLIGQYAGEKLGASGEEAAMRTRHAAYWRQVVERAEPELRGQQQSAWLNRLETERYNLRAALGWCLQAGDAQSLELGLRLAGALAGFWWVRGQSEGRDWLTALLDQRPAQPTAARARALCLAADLTLEQEGRHPAARAMYAESLQIAREAGDQPGVATALLGLGAIARAEGDAGGAEALYQQSLSLWRETGEQWGIAWALHRLGQLAFAQGELEAARAAFDECLAIRRALGDRSGQAWLFNILGEVARFRGDYQQAEALYQESLRLHEALGDKGGATATLANLGYSALNQGHHRLARTRFEASLAQSPANKGLTALGLIGLAGLTRPPERAARLLGAAELYRHEVSSPADRADHERIFAAVRAQLAASTFAAHWEAGRLLSLNEALALALDRP